MKHLNFLSLPAISIIISACASSIHPAPVEDLNALLQSQTITQTKVREYGKLSWTWPATGKIVNIYSSNNKGIDIKGSNGAPVSAAAPGKVVYAGNGLRDYGNLIIIKHNASYLSVYAHTKKMIAHEGERVNQGQKIAEIGDGESKKSILHFEIRKNGIPINPTLLLRYTTTRN